MKIVGQGRELKRMGELGIQKKVFPEANWLTQRVLNG
jgi:hypothetical protein